MILSPKAHIRAWMLPGVASRLLCRTVDCVNSHDFRGHRAGTLRITSWEIDCDGGGARVRVTVDAHSGPLVIDGKAVEIYGSVDFTELFRGWHDITRTVAREQKRRDRAWERQLTEYKRITHGIPR